MLSCVLRHNAEVTFSFDPAEEFALETDDVDSDADVVVVDGRVASGCALGLGNPAGN